MRYFQVCIFFTWTICVAKSQIFNNEFNLPFETNETVFLEKWAAVEKKLDNGIGTLMKQVLPILIRTSSEVDISEKCSNSILKLVLGIKQFKDWSWLMLDASGKIPTGIFSGTSAELGNFDQCIAIAEYDQLQNELLLRGQYCKIDVRLPLMKRTKFFSVDKPMPPLEKFHTNNFILKEIIKIHHYAYFMAFRTGVCVPSTCDINDVQNIVNYVANQAGVNGIVVSCEVKEDPHLANLQIAIIAVIGTLTLLCLLGTTVDVISGQLLKIKNKSYAEEDKALLTKIVTCFSVRRNIYRLLHVDPNRDKQYGCIHGIRFLTMTWIILGHTYMLASLQLQRNLLNGRKDTRTVSFQIVANALITVDSFFLLSGFLLSNLSINHVENNGIKSFSVPIILLRRIWRFYPSTLMTLAVTMIIPLIGSGPVWHETTDVFTENCRRKWWTDLLFVNNFVYPSKMCLPHTWYSAADVQLFLVGIIYLVIFFRYPKLGFFFNVTLVIASIVSTAVINYWHSFPPTVLLLYPVLEDMEQMFHHIHTKPYVHLGAFGVGLALGTLLAKYKKTRLSLPKVLLFWCMSITCNMSITFATYEWNNGNVPSPGFAAFYAGIHRVGWALGLAWTIFACIQGYGGVINTILSWDGFVPLGRLTFLAYLWHYLIIVIFNGYCRTGGDSFHLFFVWMFLGHLVVSFCMSVISYVLYEAPCVQLERIMMSFISKPKEAFTKPTDNFHDLKLSMKNECDQPTNTDVNVVIRL